MFLAVKKQNRNFKTLTQTKYRNRKNQTLRNMIDAYSKHYQHNLMIQGETRVIQGETRVGWGWG